jgi:RNA polymerase sigma factor (sigma-70 family)
MLLLTKIIQSIIEKGIKMANNTDILNELKANPNLAFVFLHKSHYPSIANYIKTNNGSEQDAEDIFQETIIIILEKIKQPSFALTSSLKTFQFSIARNLWLKHLRDNKLKTTYDIEQIDIEEYNETNENELKTQSVLSLLDKITIQCKRILEAIFILGEPMENLMLRMGWKNKHTAANQKYKCLEQAKKKSDLLLQ